MKKPNLNNAWGRELSNRLRSYLNLPPVAAAGDGLLNMVIGDDKYLLSLEAAEVEEVALLSLMKKTDPFRIGAQLQALLTEAGINKFLPAPVHVACKPPDRLVTMVRIPRRDENQVSRLLDTLFTLYDNIDKKH
ncbi:MAG: hypothetical protein OXD47_09960 [Gammaproteobacteria bacterium]|nr:hypothetical protein [Gammaproteobacteria bacterium]MCY4211818.1 hypothetical protein [Gammaproteobacteria bacterium]MCY4282655.1 hypothetical protein [Gammaproteobacteria bacterium]MCY4339107.1 hypothetical protein [Gammaproteobacteria bacterium]